MAEPRLPRLSLSYAEIEYVLAKLHGATGDVQQKAFRGRLKHLKRLGIPQGIHPGRGAKIYYLEEQLFEWAFCLELAEVGLDPTVIVRFMNDNWAEDILPQLEKIWWRHVPPVEVLRARKSGTESAWRPPPDEDVYFLANPEFMSAAWQDQQTALSYRWVELSDADKWPRWIGRGAEPGAKKRAIIINVTALLKQIGQLSNRFHSKRS